VTKVLMTLDDEQGIASMRLTGIDYEHIRALLEEITNLTHGEYIALIGHLRGLDGYARWDE
jgi:hypothetical protein